ncbi:MAG: hypothetical protein H6R08_397 [Proteobacteria bacterium]|nr:hypothetical protein [Pseudomonadota bacterium]
MPQATSLFTDVESKVVGTSAVVIYSPSGRKRNGPSRSSEGFKLFYLVRWLD